jgi:hypothetical protein
MKKLIYISFILLFVFNTSILAMGNKSHNKDHHIALVSRVSGPVLKAFTENATLFVIDILNVAHIVESEEDGYLNFDLFPLGLSNGKYRIKITPVNIVGEAPTVEFDLQISGGKVKLWRIVPIQKLLNEDPEYKNYFSEDLSVFTDR